VKLKYLDKWNEERRKIAEIYAKEIHNAKVVLPKMPKDIKEHVFHIYPVLVENRTEFIEYLREQGIATNVHYPIPITEQKAYEEFRGQIENYPVNERKICAQRT